MNTVLLVARVLLALVFGAAGATKLADRTGTRTALTGFGVPYQLVGLLAWLLPLTEIVVAALLYDLALVEDEDAIDPADG